MASLSKSNLRENIFLIIVSLFSIEYISFGEYFSIFRVIIFPLCLLGLFIWRPIFTYKNIKFYFIVGIALLVNILSSLNSGNLIFGIINSIGIMVFVIFILNHISIFGISKRLIYAIAIFSIPQYIAFFSWISNAPLNFTNSSSRFVGAHIDSNFLCVYLNLAVVAKLFLLRSKNFKFNSFIISFIFFDLLLIFYSQSRAGILTFFLSILIFLFFYYKRLLLISLVSFFFIGTYFVQKVNSLTYSSDFGLIDAVIWRFSKLGQEGEIEEARITHFNNFIHLVEQGNSIFVGYSLDNYLLIYYQYPHSLFIDIFLEQGLIFGGFFILYLLFLFWKGFKMAINGYSNPFLFHLSIVAFIGTVTLTSYKQKFFWFIVVLAFLSTQKLNFNFNEKN